MVPIGDELSQCIIFNTKTRMALIIEGDETYLEVMKRMKDAGVRALDRLP